MMQQIHLNLWQNNWITQVTREYELQFQLDVHYIIINYIIIMNWTDSFPYLGLYYPLYDYNFQLQMQRTYIEAFPSQFMKNSRETPESHQIINTLETSSQLLSDRNDSKSSFEENKKLVKKQKQIKKRQREDNFERKKQKKDRNIPSNIFKYFVTHLYGNKNLSQLFVSLKEKGINIQLDTFLEKIKDTIPQTQSYIRPATIQELCSDTILNKQESLAFRIIIKRFLLLELPIMISPMQKYRKRQRRELIKVGRKLFDQLRQKAFQ